MALHQQGCRGSSSATPHRSSSSTAPHSTGDVRPPGPAPARLQEQQQQQEGDVRPHGPAPAQQQQQHGGGDGGDDGGGHTVEDEVGQTVLKERAYGGEHRVQEGDGEDAGDAGAHAGEDAGDAGADAGEDAGEDEEEKQSEEKQEGDHATTRVEAVIASQGWRGGRRHPPRIRRKINKY